LLYLRDNPDDQTRHALMVLNTDGSGTARVIRQGVGLSCDWSPDGRHLLTQARATCSSLTFTAPERPSPWTYRRRVVAAAIVY
jgi:hypothetical protein